MSGGCDSSATELVNGGDGEDNAEGASDDAMTEIGKRVANLLNIAKWSTTENQPTMVRWRRAVQRLEQSLSRSLVPAAVRRRLKAWQLSGETSQRPKNPPPPPLHPDNRALRPRPRRPTRRRWCSTRGRHWPAGPEPRAVDVEWFLAL